MGKFDLFEEYRAYLTKLNLKEDMLSEVQNTEMKRAFMAGAGSTFLFLSNTVTDMGEREALRALDGLNEQISDFWKEEVRISEQRKKEVSKQR